MEFVDNFYSSGCSKVAMNSPRLVKWFWNRSTQPACIRSISVSSDPQRLTIYSSHSKRFLSLILFMFYNESHLCSSFPFNFLTPHSLFRLFAYHRYSDSNHTTSNLPLWQSCVYWDWCKSSTLNATLFSACKLPVFQECSCFISSTDHTYSRYICIKDWANETLVLCPRLCNLFWIKYGLNKL